MCDEEHLSQAMECIQKGLEAEKKQKYFAAMEFFLKSLSLCPTAEGHTYYGWMLSRFGLYREAIQECLKAIEIKPEWGNPYNDIGSYLIELRQYDEAVPWLKKAIEAKDYSQRHLPILNLARIFEIRGDYEFAMEFLRRAAFLAPHSPQVKKWMVRILAHLN
ncbi:MAG: tetratricopeptide repeat protein [bacterium JZ-2024 1]